MKRIKLVQIDGKMPNLALMKLAHWHRSRGDEVRLTRSVQPNLFDQEGVDTVYGSAIFKRSRPLADTLRALHPGAIVGGTGSGEELGKTVEQVLGTGPWEYERYDYGIYPGYPLSLGFTQRGCRLNCSFCVVPRKEGKPVGVNTIGDIWRGPGYPRSIILLDNDFFGQPRDEWQARLEEIREGGFQVNFNQGINIRTITEEAAAAIARVPYHNHRFTRRRLHTAWDNLGQERVFFRGVERLEAAGVPPQHLMVYMLVGFDPEETMERVLHRHRKLTERGCSVFPMVYEDIEPDAREEMTPEELEAWREWMAKLRKFQRWVLRRYDQFVPWEDFQRGGPEEKGTPKTPSLFDLHPPGGDAASPAGREARRAIEEEHQ